MEKALNGMSWNEDDDDDGKRKLGEDAEKIEARRERRGNLEF